MIPQATAEHYLLQQRLSAATVAAVRIIWARMGMDLDASFARVGPQLVAVIAAAQLGAARSASPYVARVLDETNLKASAVAEVHPAAFAGVASGGGALIGLVAQAVIRTKAALVLPSPGEVMLDRFGVQAAAPPEVRMRQALNAGGRFLDMAVQSEVADAGRGATQTAMAVRPALGGGVRMVNLPACKRCVVLAGRFYKWNASFRRHPGCDCIQTPANESTAHQFTTDPDEAYRAGMVTGIKRADRQAIEDGADFSQVVNARRDGSMSADGLWTREGTTRHGFASSRIRSLRDKATETAGRERGRIQHRVMRPTVDQIYKYAESRQDAITLLHRTGYII